MSTAEARKFHFTKYNKILFFKKLFEKCFFEKKGEIFLERIFLEKNMINLFRETFRGLRQEGALGRCIIHYCCQ